MANDRNDLNDLNGRNDRNGRNGRNVAKGIRRGGGAVVKLGWGHLCLRHFGQDPDLISGISGISGISARQIQAHFAVPADEAEHRAWLCGRDVSGSRYIADVATIPMRAWPIREVRWDGGGKRDVQPGRSGTRNSTSTSTSSSTSSSNVRLFTLCNPKKKDGERFIAERLLPCLLQTCALLREATSTNPAIDVTYVDTPQRRSMPEATSTAPSFASTPAVVIVPDSINGGVTYHSVGARKRVIVYRREDACKVLVHELVHAFRLDSALWTSTSPDALAADRAFAKRHQVSPIDPLMPLGISEAYTEALACYVHAWWWHFRKLLASGAGAASGTRSKTRTKTGAAEGTDRASGGIDRASGGIDRASGTEGIHETLGRLSAHIEDVGRRVDAACSDGGRREFREGTHAFAYAVCRAAVWSTGAMPRMLEMWPPGFPPRNPADFAVFLDGAIEAWGRARTTPSSRKLRITSDIPPGLMMTPLQ